MSEASFVVVNGKQFSLQDENARRSIGDCGNLQTSTKHCLVDAINELCDQSGGSSGDMEAATYDPQGKAQDVFAYVDNAVDNIPTPDVSGQINAHNTNGNAHSDIRAVANAALPKSGGTMTGDLILSGCNLSDGTNSIAVADIADKSTIPTTAEQIGADPSGSAATALTNAKAYTDTKISDLIGGAPETLDTLKEVADAISENESVVDGLNAAIGNKADKSEVDKKADKADIATTKFVGSATGSASYFKISDFGSWGTGNWTQKGFSMLITSRAGEMVWVTVAANDSNTDARAFRLMNRYSKISNIYYSASESAIYVKAAAWCNNICAHILTNVYGDYVPTVATVSGLASDAVEINIVEFGINSTSTVVGDSSVKLELGGSGDRPTYNGSNVALQSDIPTDTNTTYALSKSGSTITLTGSDGSTTSVTDDVSSGGGGGNYLPLTGGTMTGNITVNNSNPYLGLQDTSGKIAYFQTYDDGSGLKAGFGYGWANSLKLDSSGNMSVVGSISEGGAALSNKYAPKSHSHGYIQDGTVGIKSSDSNEISFASNNNVLYFGYDNRLGSTALVDTYKFGTHSGVDNSTSGRIECGSIGASGAVGISGGAHISGRYFGSGDDEGLVIGRASNQYAGLILGTNSGVRSVMYLMPDNSAVWRYNNGSTTYDVKHPAKAGTMALRPNKVSITLSASAWTSGTDAYEQTVTVSGGTANSMIALQPTVSQIATLQSDGVTALVVDNNSGTFIAKAVGAAPSTEMTIQASVTEVTA